jgi:hypothetical protein
LLEAVENVANVMGNLLKTQTRLDTTKDKLIKLGTEEGQQIPYSILWGNRVF